ncbi:MAG: adenosylcobalamin-dependent ribonucleoside-diphosphate reductase [Candidatus Omnitrophica bacterium]|nr:adenosylcobalamin-dependent ribonucleoside-diphosphate reductase [Candidatus Omnitrophota bacterium]
MNKLTPNALEVLKRRYLQKDARGRVIETPEVMFRRVAHHVAAAENHFGPKNYAAEWESIFFEAMSRLEFLPNSPTLMNAGGPLGQLAACFVLPVQDSMESIFDAVKYTALIHQSGGGTGFSFSHLRPARDVVRSTHGVSSGPVSFMRVFDAATEAVKQGGARRGANMGILRVDHPDILDFIQSKRGGAFANFNLSVGVTNAFMKAVRDNKNYPLINPRNQKTVRTISAKKVFDVICECAWENGDPGLVFLDRIEADNPTPELGELESTNPCGEQPLLAYESCNLGSINLAKLVTGGHLDFDRLARLVDVGLRFLDDVIEVNHYPVLEIRNMTLANRKIGLGVMGFADALIQLGIPYNSAKAIQFAETVMKFIQERSKRASRELAQERGAFPNFERSSYARDGAALRNATTTTIAPTGTLSVIAGCSSGIEPLFGISFWRNILEGSKLLEVNPYFERAAKTGKFYSKLLMKEIATRGSCYGLKSVPKAVQKIFVTSFDLAPEDHIRMQAAFQKFTDNAVSKTVNLPEASTKEEVKKVYLLAYRLGCKGVTIYRNRSRTEQVLNLAKE